eukprot:Phypoly_transcript_06706.p1 GENE.Phypoly_transcript_06706~~Phypoly_transcript_06706.p1  ORF type:complete len:350 (+),score=37.75 Phypoly_transcript_06706:83-1132(+)
MRRAEDSDFDPPPMFTPHVYIQERGEKRTFGPKGYMMRLARFMVSDYDTVRPILAVAKKFNITVTWKRILEVFVHEAQGLEKQAGLSVHDVRLKVVVDKEIRRTQIVGFDTADLTSVWNESLKFHVGEPSNIEILAYCKNAIIPNDKLGRISIMPLELVERRTITEWFQFSTKGKVKLSITVSPPAIAPFKFTFGFDPSAREWNIVDIGGERVFTVAGQWPYSLNICTDNDNGANTVDFSIQNVIFTSHEKEFEIKFGPENNPQKVTVLAREEHEFQVTGLASVEQVRSSQTEFSLYSPTQVCVGMAQGDSSRSSAKYSFEIRPGQDLMLVLAVMFLVAKLRHQKGKVQ